MEIPGPNIEMVGADRISVTRRILELNPKVTSVLLFTHKYVKDVFALPNQQIPLSREEVLGTDIIREMAEQLPKGLNLALSSKVVLDTGENVHIPMMDFSILKGDSNLNLLTDQLRFVGVNDGWIFETEYSYQFYGHRLLSRSDWYNFLGNCLLTSKVHERFNIEQVADARYIGYCLKRGYCGLRPVATGDKTFNPRVIRYLSSS